MDNKIFKFLDHEVIKEIANIGAGNAVTSLAKMREKKISMNVPEVKTPEFKNLTEGILNAEDLVAGLLVYISGDIDAMMMYIMDEKSACAIINHLMKEEKKEFSDFNEMDISALKEIGNIMTGSYLTALSTFMNFKINKSVPYMCIDMAGAILSVPAIEFGKVSDRVVLIKSVFNDNEDLNGYFILIPNAESDRDVDFGFMDA